MAQSHWQRNEPHRIACSQSSFSWDLHEWASGRHGVTQTVVSGSVPMLDVSARSTEGVVLNGPNFPVHQGAQFELHFSWDVSLPSDEAGYAALIFLGPDGIEFRRTLPRLLSTWRPVATVVTGVNGEVRLPELHLGRIVNCRTALVYYQGDGAHRPTWLQLR